MKNKISSKKLSLVFVFLLLVQSVFNAQIDTAKTDISLTSIGDSLVTDDSTKIKQPRKPFFIKENKGIFSTPLNTFKVEKKAVDKLDYRYIGDIINFLPFSYLSSFGYTGQPSEAKIFSFGYGNFSATKNNVSLNNRWNNSIDLNSIQAEALNTLEIIPINRGFLYGASNNISTINILTKDTLKSKPISRIRYYQASNEEGFIDAFFSARVLSKLAISIRATNLSINENYKNTDYGAWKLNTKATYKISESTFAEFDYYHVKLNTPLFGGVDINKVLSSTSVLTNDLYNKEAQVLNNNMSNETTNHRVNFSLYGNLISLGKTRLTFNYNNNKDRFAWKLNDSTKIGNKNLYTITAATLNQNILWNNIYSDFYLGYENIDYNIKAINVNKKFTNLYFSFISSIDLFDSSLTPSIFGKFSKYEEQSNNGFGFDVKLELFHSLKLFAGFSNFQKPFSLIEQQYFSDKTTQSFNTTFISAELYTKGISSSLSAFIVKGKNVPLPVFNTSNIQSTSSKIIFNSLENSTTNGFNLNSTIEYWNVQTFTNLNYYWLSKNPLSTKKTNFNLVAGIYYVDTLFNSNLDLKTGVTFYLYDSPSYMVYDFQKMRSTPFYLDNNSVKQFDYYKMSNNKYRLDFLLSGRIQDAATFYFVYENILGNNYYIVPYYPMPKGGIKIGIAWDFID